MVNKNIIKVTLKSFFKIPLWLIKLNKYKNGKKKEEAYFFTQEVSKNIIKSLDIECDCKGIENLPKENGYLIVANHQGLFDPILLVSQNNAPFIPIVKNELGNIPIIKRFLQIINALFMDRDDLKQSLSIIIKATEYVKNKQNVLIFPEGTRSCSNNLLEFKVGSFKIATKNKAPIVPIAFVNSYTVFDNNYKITKPIYMHILKPIYYDEYKDMKNTELCEYVRKKIEEKISIILK